MARSDASRLDAKDMLIDHVPDLERQAKEVEVVMLAQDCEQACEFFWRELSDDVKKLFVEDVKLFHVEQASCERCVWSDELHVGAIVVERRYHGGVEDIGRYRRSCTIF